MWPRNEAWILVAAFIKSADDKLELTFDSIPVDFKAIITQVLLHLSGIHRIQIRHGSLLRCRRPFWWCRGGDWVRLFFAAALFGGGGLQLLQILFVGEILSRLVTAVKGLDLDSGVLLVKVIPMRSAFYVLCEC